MVTDCAEQGYRFGYLSAAKQTPLMSLDELLDAAEAAVTKRTDWFYAVGEDDAAMRGTSQALAFVVYAVTVRDVNRSASTLIESSRRATAAGMTF